jgi:hypothetical protein
MMKFRDLQQVFDTYRLYADRGVVRMVALSVIANQLLDKGKKPLWVVFIAPPSGGKSDIIATISEIKKDGKHLCEKISDLTSASLASGMKTLEGENSLLERLNKNGGMMVFKDFTTILSKRKEDLAMIMAYLREIYDEEFEKTFGNGKKIEFKGKVGIIAACTTIIYHVLGELSVMGDRLMFYQIEQADKRDVQKKIFENEDAGIDGSKEMTSAMTDYIHGVMDHITANREAILGYKIDKALRAELADVSIFACAARTGVVWNYKKDTISFVPDGEAPHRMLKQFIAMATGLMVMNDAEGAGAVLTENDKKLIYKVAFDSVPSMRRQIIRIVAKYAMGATDQGIADQVGMQYEAVKIWIEELAAVKVFTKKLDPVSRKAKYFLVDEYLETVRRFEQVEQVNEELVSQNDTSNEYGDL